MVDIQFQFFSPWIPLCRIHRIEVTRMTLKTIKTVIRDTIAVMSIMAKSTI